MYVAVIPNRGSPPAILLRESYREAGKTKNRTLANLSRWPAERIAQLRAVLRGDQLLPAAEAVEIVRSLPHGHVLAALGTARRIALDAVLPRLAAPRRRISESGALNRTLATFSLKLLKRPDTRRISGHVIYSISVDRHIA